MANVARTGKERLPRTKKTTETPLEKSVLARRIRAGQSTPVPIQYEWGRTDSGLPTLAIRCGKSLTTYVVGELPCDPDFRGRAFSLIKLVNSTTLEAYNTFVASNGQDHICDCRGQEAHGRCKHVSVLYASWNRGELPGDVPPVEKFPSDRQVEEETEIELPF